MGLLNFLFGSETPKEKGKRDEKLEREMNRYGLSEEEKKLVRSGKYDPWNFEEEELEEDDYYYDDE